MRTFVLILSLAIASALSCELLAKDTRSVNVGPTLYTQVSHTDTAPISIYELASKNQHGVRGTSLFTIEIAKVATVTPDEWRARMLSAISTNPQCTASTTSDGVVIFIIRSPQMVEYNFWKFGLTKSGAAVANGLAWRFTGIKCEEEFQKFSPTEGKEAYDNFVKTPIAE